MTRIMAQHKPLCSGLEPIDPHIGFLCCIPMVRHTLDEEYYLQMLGEVYLMGSGFSRKCRPCVPRLRAMFPVCGPDPFTSWGIYHHRSIWRFRDRCVILTCVKL